MSDSNTTPGQSSQGQPQIDIGSLLSGLTGAMQQMAAGINKMVDQNEQILEKVSTQQSVQQPVQEKIDTDNVSYNVPEVEARCVDIADGPQGLPNTMIFATRSSAEQRMTLKGLTPYRVDQQGNVTNWNCELYTKTMPKVEFDKLSTSKSKFL